MVQRVSAGQMIPHDWPRATDWNDIGEATEEYLRHHRTRDGAQKKQWIIPTEWFFARNDTGNRRAGEVLEAGDYLLAELDPMSLWFVGQAPTNPVHESTHGVLRVACKNGDMERVQVSGNVRAWVNVTDASHNFCDAAVGSHVLQSNTSGPHKIVYKPGTGEVECVILLYAAGPQEVLFEAYLLNDMCATDSGGTGTGSESQTVLVINAKLMPSCTSFSPARVINSKNHEGPAGSLVSGYKRVCNGVEEWVIDDVELQPLCAMAGIEDRPSCLVGWGLKIRAEWCPASEPDEACIIVLYDDCTVVLPPCDVTLNFNPLYACCGSGQMGSGSGYGT